MKRILKNNSIIITALCIMIAIVWYLNYTEGDKTQVANGDNVVYETVDDDYDYYSQTLTENGLELSELIEDENSDLAENENSSYVEDAYGLDEYALTEDGLELETADGYGDAALAEGDEYVEDEYADISDEDLAEMDEVETSSDSLGIGESAMVSDTGEIVSDEVATTDEDGTDTSTPGEAVLASTTISSSYFASAKLTREQNRAREKESLMEMMESDSISEELKQQAVDSYLLLNELVEKENATELLLEAKGFEGAVVTIVDDCVDVVINAPTITEQEIAQIESIVKRKTEVEAENIVISAVVVEE